MKIVKAQSNQSGFKIDWFYLEAMKTYGVEKVVECLLFLEKEDLLQKARNSESAKTIKRLILALMLDYDTVIPGNYKYQENYRKSCEEAFRKNKKSVERLIKYLESVENIAQQLKRSESRSSNSDEGSRRDCHVFKLLAEMVLARMSGLVDEFHKEYRLWKNLYSKSGGRFKHAEKLFVYRLVHVAKSYCDFVDTEAYSFVSWFLNRCPVWRKGEKGANRKISPKRVSQIYEEMKKRS